MRGIRRTILAGVLAGVVLPPVARGDENRAAARIEAMVNFTFNPAAGAEQIPILGAGSGTPPEQKKK